MKKLLLGLIISIVFIYFSFRGVDYKYVLKGFENVNYFFLAPSIFLLLSHVPLRALRLGVILSPLEEISQKKLLPITCVGYMAIVILPMRMGELVRPYLVSTKSRVPLSSAFASIFVERVFDMSVMLGILFSIIISSPFPDWIIRSGYGFMFTLIASICLMFLLYMKTDGIVRLIKPLLKRISEDFQLKIEKIIYNFVDGLKIIKNPLRLFIILALSILTWALSGLAVYSLFLFYNFELPFISAFLVLVITMLGITLPSAPGFLGNFQFACICALLLFDIPKGDALTFSIIYYLLALGITIFLGLVFIPSVDFSFKELIQRIKDGFKRT